jgi:hypothetical protein
MSFHYNFEFAASNENKITDFSDISISGKYTPLLVKKSRNLNAINKNVYSTASYLSILTVHKSFSNH